MYAQIHEWGPSFAGDPPTHIFEDVQPETLPEGIVVPVVPEREGDVFDAFGQQHLRTFHQVELHLRASHAENRFHPGKVREEQLAETLDFDHFTVYGPVSDAVRFQPFM